MPKVNKSKNKTPAGKTAAALNAVRRAERRLASQEYRTLAGPRQMTAHLSQVGSPRIRFHGREMVQLISTTQNYGGVAIGINPANNAAFPRLAGIANSYQRFRFRKLHAVYIPACPATQAGQVALAFVEDVLQDLPDSIPLVINLSGSAGGSVVQAYTAQMRDPDPTWRYCGLTSNVGSGNLHYQGNLIVSTQGGTNDTDAAGYLWFDYDVEFEDPRGTFDLAVQRSVTPRGVSGTQVATDAGTLLDLPSTWSDVGTIGLSLLQPAVGVVVEHFKDYLVSSTAYMAIEAVAASRFPSDPDWLAVPGLTDQKAAYMLEIEAGAMSVRDDWVELNSSPTTEALAGRIVRVAMLRAAVPGTERVVPRDHMAEYRVTDAAGRPARRLGGTIAVLPRRCACVVEPGTPAADKILLGGTCCSRSKYFWYWMRRLVHTPDGLTATEVRDIGLARFEELARPAVEHFELARQVASCKAGVVYEVSQSAATGREMTAAQESDFWRRATFTHRGITAAVGNFDTELSEPGTLRLPAGLQWYAPAAAGDVSVAIMLLDEAGAELSALYDHLTNAPGATVYDGFAQITNFASNSTVHTLQPKVTTATGETRVVQGGTIGVQLIDLNETAGIVAL